MPLPFQGAGRRRACRAAPHRDTRASQFIFDTTASLPLSFQRRAVTVGRHQPGCACLRPTNPWAYYTNWSSSTSTLKRTTPLSTQLVLRTECVSAAKDKDMPGNVYQNLGEFDEIYRSTATLLPLHRRTGGYDLSTPSLKANNNIQYALRPCPPDAAHILSGIGCVG